MFSRRYALLLLCASCATDAETCIRELEPSVRAGAASVAWPIVEPAPHLHLSRDELVWDEATDVYHHVRRGGTCPDPFPGEPSVLATFDPPRATELLDQRLRSSPGLRIEPDVPFDQVEWVLARLRAAGAEEVHLREVGCVEDRCASQSRRFGLVDWPPPEGHTYPRHDFESAQPAPSRGPIVSHIHFHIVDIPAGWRLRWQQGDFACDGDPSRNPGDIYSCVRQSRSIVPNERWASVEPSATRTWGEVMHLMSRVQRRASFAYLYLPPRTFAATEWDALAEPWVRVVPIARVVSPPTEHELREHLQALVPSIRECVNGVSQLAVVAVFEPDGDVRLVSSGPREALVCARSVLDARGRLKFSGRSTSVRHTFRF